MATSNPQAPKDPVLTTVPYVGPVSHYIIYLDKLGIYYTGQDAKGNPSFNADVYVAKTFTTYAAAQSEIATLNKAHEHSTQCSIQLFQLAK